MELLYPKISVPMGFTMDVVVDVSRSQTKKIRVKLILHNSPMNFDETLWNVLPSRAV